MSSVIINQPLVVATTQELLVNSINVNFEEGTIDVSVVIKNENGEVVKGFSHRFAGEKASAFWTGFVSKKAMYEMLLLDLGIQVEVQEMEDVIIEDNPQSYQVI